jgi:hypothetical protein
MEADIACDQDEERLLEEGLKAVAELIKDSRTANYAKADGVLTELAREYPEQASKHKAEIQALAARIQAGFTAICAGS